MKTQPRKRRKLKPGRIDTTPLPTGKGEYFWVRNAQASADVGIKKIDEEFKSNYILALSSVQREIVRKVLWACARGVMHAMGCSARSGVDVTSAIDPQHPNQLPLQDP